MVKKRPTFTNIIEQAQIKQWSGKEMISFVKKVVLLITLSFVDQSSWAAAPLYSWQNNLGHSGSGFGDPGSAYGAAIADSLANYDGAYGPCTADPLGGSFPNWSAVLHGCADVRVNAYCPSNTQVNNQTQSCDLPGNVNDPNLAVGKPQTCVGDPCDSGARNKIKRSRITKRHQGHSIGR